jgi:hypothetical protein
LAVFFLANRSPEQGGSRRNTTIFYEPKMP